MTLSVRIAAAALTAALLLASAAACGSGDSAKPADAPAQAGDAPQDQQDNGNAEETEPEIKPDLPETDMGGAVINILTEDWAGYTPLDMDDISVEDLNGEDFNDAIFQRQKKIEEEYNCVIVQMDYASGDGQSNLLKAASAGDDAYQIAVVRSNQYSKLLSSGALMEIKNVPHIDLEKPWYDKNSLSALGLLNRTFGIVSNITMNSYKLIFCAYCNMNMMDDFGLGNIYEIVYGGKWTWDQMYGMGKTVSADLNSDGKYTTDDRYGFTYIIDDPEGLLNAAGVRYATLDSDGIPQPSLNNERTITLMQKLLDILVDKETSLNVHLRSDNTPRDEVGMFMNKQALFSLAGIYYAPQFRPMEDHFGIIPLPKYDEAQEGYNAPMFGNVFPLTAIPSTVADTEKAGIITEAMSYEGYTGLLSSFYGTLLQGKVTRDEESNKMLDLIFGSTFYDSGLLYQFGGMLNSIRTIYNNLKGDFASTIAKNESKVQKDIDKLIESISGIE